MTINTYLQSAVIGMSISDAQVEFVIANVDGLVSGAELSTVSVQQKDLALAEVLWLVARSVGGGSYSKKVNNRQIAETLGRLTNEQRLSMIDEANSLRKKYGLPAFQEGNVIYDATILW
jgi:hypothetical protein